MTVTWPEPRCPTRLARVPVPTFASLSSTVESKCRNHEEHKQAFDSRVAFASDVWLRAEPRVGPKRQLRYTRVPVPTFASLSSTVESKCRNHEEHEQAFDSRVAFASDVWLRATPRVGPKRQMRYTSTHAITNSARRVSNNKTVVRAVEALSSASDLPSDASHGLERAPLPHAAEQEAGGGWARSPMRARHASHTAVRLTSASSSSRVTITSYSAARRNRPFGK